MEVVFLLCKDKTTCLKQSDLNEKSKYVND